MKHALTSSLTKILLTSPVLPLLKYLQSTLDILDIEGLQHLWNATHTLEEKKGLALGEGQTQPSMSEWEAALGEYLHRFPLPPSLPSRSPLSQLEAEKLLTKGRQNAATFAHSPNKEELRYQILAYLLSATFKDCSILIRFDNPATSPVSSSGTPPFSASAPPSAVTTQTENPTTQRPPPPRASIALIDLSSKPINRLEKWAVLDRDIALGYAEFLKSSGEGSEEEKRRNA